MAKSEAPLRKVAVVGAGKIGSTAIDLLVGSGGYEVLALDGSPAALAALDPPGRITRRALAVEDPQALARALGERFAVVNCAPFQLTE
ncbi:MAG: saccharopine dehydrogenase, partial [Phenylobacterium sp.]|nr:saccharopine dehydrogenase [Phenylobacterium sp.]